MITGFNTDVEHNGTVYHVQTEDKGLDTPFILSLVYVGGAILASKRAPYNDLVAAGFDAALLGERLQRQHKLICAAIAAGRVEDLKRLSQREPTEATPTRETADAAREATPPNGNRAGEKTARGQRHASDIKTGAAEERATADEQASEATIAGGVPSVATETPAQPPTPALTEMPPNSHGAPHVFETIAAEIEGELHVSLLEEKDFRAGDIVTLRVAVSRGAFGERESVRGASVVVKVLGTEFRPLILTSKSDADGVASVHVWLPRFKRGRAAILVRATADGCSAELRRAILQL